jgi:hypothetical protein
VTKIHKAQYSKAIVDEIRDILLERYPEFWQRPKLWDPYAGPGLKLVEIAGDEFDYGGTEIEPSFIQNPRIAHGTATDPGMYPNGSFVICTSPVYPNGVADHATMNDTSTRNNYRAWVGQIEGADRELADENMGRWGYRGTKRGGKSLRRQVFWDIAERSVKNWDRAELVIVNVSDFISGSVVEPYVADWVQLMMRYRWQIVESRRVATPRLGQGENHDVRVPFEMILVFERVRI